MIHHTTQSKELSTGILVAGTISGLYYTLKAPYDLYETGEKNLEHAATCRYLGMLSQLVGIGYLSKGIKTQDEAMKGIAILGVSEFIGTTLHAGFVGEAGKKLNKKNLVYYRNLTYFGEALMVGGIALGVHNKNGELAVGLIIIGKTITELIAPLLIY